MIAERFKIACTGILFINPTSRCSGSKQHAKIFFLEHKSDELSF